MTSILCSRVCLAFLVIAGLPKMMTAERRERRSDDAEPLEAVVNQLAQQVNSLGAQLNSVKAELTELKRKTDTPVAFYAWSRQHISTTAQGTLILDHAETNLGNAYNTRTGVFTTPVPGLYQFQLTFLAKERGSGNEDHVGIYVDEKLAAIGVSDTEHGQWDQTTISCVLHVQAGQEVYAKNFDNIPREYFESPGFPFTNFFGLLVHAD